MQRAELSLPGEAAVVTAGGAGIGREIANNLTEAGVDVVINDIDQATLEEACDALEVNDGDCIPLAGDASDPETAKNLVETADDEFGSLDIVVNNVGIAGPTKPCEEITPAEFMETLEVNLGAMFATTRAAIPYLRESEDGRLVNISSMSGKRPLEYRTPYTTSKMGVIGFTRTLAKELATDGVTVNAICPGSVEGERLVSVIQGQAESQDRPYEEVEREFREVSPMQEFVQPTDVANTVLFLCSDQAARMTGQDLNVTAGITMY
jgi:NAD(P)-dependent dehydrogenase (short-subunit alcohol dehydrogenase family)